MQAFIKILVGIGMSLVTESVIKTICAEALEYLVQSTKNDLDNRLAAPVIEELRK